MHATGTVDMESDPFISPAAHILSTENQNLDLHIFSAITYFVNIWFLFLHLVHTILEYVVTIRIWEMTNFPF